jgi:amidase
MSDANARSDGNSGAGVLELLRLFRGNDAAADQYAISCREKALAVEPVLKAFEYLPLDVVRKPGPLSGIPVGIKDIIATTDMPTTNGSPIYRDHVPDADAWIVERLRNLGAAIFGKTVSTEFAWRHPGADGQSMESKAHAGRFVIRFRSSRRGGNRSAGVGHANAGLHHPAGCVQWCRRLQTQFRRYPSHRRAPA